MQMEIFEFGVYVKKKLVAGFNDINKANLYALETCKKEHCNVDIINTFTGEVHLSLESYVKIVYDTSTATLKRKYEIKEREW